MKQWLITLLLPLTLIGCSTGDSKPTMSSDSPQVIFYDSGLDERLSVEDISTKNHNGLSEAVVHIKNDYSGDLQLQYRFYWYNEEGFEINANESWETFVVRSLDVLELTETAIKPEATQFKIAIRELD